MPFKNWRVDSTDEHGSRCKTCDVREVPPKSVVHHEGSCFRVHAGCERNVNQVFLLLQSRTIVDLGIRQDLCEQHDRRLRVVLVNIRHVQVIDEVDALFVAWWAKSAPRALVHTSHQNCLQCKRSRIIVEVDRRAHVILGFSLLVCKVVLDNDSLASSCDTDVQYRLVPLHVQIQNILHALQVYVADDDVLIHLLCDGVVLVHPILPVNPLLCLWLKSVVYRIANIWKLYHLG
mmetsp:Transcript_139284/g.242434  ORF Transcript_139284/g.242434 Transcript_139284/m.242434 type:complete len:233 (+) Transcript_139284:5833-6531(+)